MWALLVGYNVGESANIITLAGKYHFCTKQLEANLHSLHWKIAIVGEALDLPINCH